MKEIGLDSLKGRIIYRIENDKILIRVVKTTGTHDMWSKKKPLDFKCLSINSLFQNEVLVE